MSSIVECPVCEEQFDVQLAADNRNKTRCPSCKRVFEVTDSTIVSEVGGATTAPTLRASPEAQVSFQKPTAEKQTSDPQFDIGGQLVAAGAIEKRALDIRGRYDARKKSNSVRFASFMVAVALLTSLLGLWLIFRVGNPPTSTAQANSDNTAAEVPESNDSTSVAQTSKSSSPRSNRKTTKTKVKNQAPDSLVPPDPQVPKHFSQSELDECWNIVSPHLLSLKVKSPAGIQRATGTLIDSRGWIVTSYHAVKDAWQIEATAATNSIDDSDQEPPLTDLVRGIIATDPQRDLAILEVNRRFVVSFADLVVAKTNRTVAGEYLVQCGPPLEKHPFRTWELKIQQRLEDSELPESVNSTLERLQLDTKQTWLVTDSGDHACPGMPVFQTDGTLVALNVFSDGKKGYLLPVTSLKPLIDSASGESKPLQRPMGVTSTGNEIALDLTGPGQEMVSELNKSGLACEPFRWLPQTAEQYESLQQFSVAVMKAFDFITEHEDEGEVQLVQQRLGFWEKQLAANLGRMVVSNRERLTKINEFAKSEIKKGNKNHVVFFGSVFLSGIESPKQILKLDGQESYVNVPTDLESEPMRPGTHWLFFVETMPLARPVNFTVDKKGTIRTESATVLYAVGPIPDA